VPEKRMDKQLTQYQLNYDAERFSTAIR
jgi:hypothetical protein